MTFLSTQFWLKNCGPTVAVWQETPLCCSRLWVGNLAVAATRSGRSLWLDEAGAIEDTSDPHRIALTELLGSSGPNAGSGDTKWRMARRAWGKVTPTGRRPEALVMLYR